MKEEFEGFSDVFGGGKRGFEREWEGKGGKISIDGADRSKLVRFVGDGS